MSKKHQHLGPHRISDRVWWYELPNGIEIYHEAISGKNATSILIPWRDIRNALKRKDKK